MGSGQSARLPESNSNTENESGIAGDNFEHYRRNGESVAPGPSAQPTADSDQCHREFEMGPKGETAVKSRLIGQSNLTAEMNYRPDARQKRWRI